MTNEERIAELEAELERTKIFAEEAEKVNSECLAYQRDIIAAMKAAGDALAEHAKHIKGCNVDHWLYAAEQTQCRCGLNEALATWSASNGH